MPVRKDTRIYRDHSAPDDRGYMPGTMEERLSIVWELTQSAWAFVPRDDAYAEQRLQRNVAVLVRRGR